LILGFPPVLFPSIFPSRAVLNSEFPRSIWPIQFLCLTYSNTHLFYILKYLSNLQHITKEFFSLLSEDLNTDLSIKSEVVNNCFKM